MKNIKTLGYVLSEREIGDYDKVFDILTAEKGKLSCIARGIRRPKGKYKSVVELFNLLNLDLFPGKSFFYVTQAQVIDHHQSIKNQLPLVSFSYLASEIISIFLKENQQISQVFHLVDFFFKNINSENKEKVFLIFLFHFLKKLGFISHVFHCSRCQKKFSPQEKYFWNKGEMFCLEHRSGLEISLAMMKILRFFYQQDLSECLKIKIDIKENQKLNQMMLHAAENIAGRKFKSRKFFQAI